MLCGVKRKMENDRDDFSHKKKKDGDKVERPQFCPIGRDTRMLPATFARTCSKFKADAHTTKTTTSLAKLACLECPIGKAMLEGKNPRNVVKDGSWIPLSELKVLNKEHKVRAVALTDDQLSRHKINKKKRIVEHTINEKKQEYVRKAFADDVQVSADTFLVKRRQEAFMRKVEHIKETLRGMCVGLTIDQRKELLLACTSIIAFEGMQEIKKKKAPKTTNAATPRTEKKTERKTQKKGKSLELGRKKKETLGKQSNKSKAARKGVVSVSGNLSFRNDPRVIKQVQALRDQGLKHSEIAHKIDISPTTVSRIVHDLKKRVLHSQTAL